jgi:hypothetical protein
MSGTNGETKIGTTVVKKGLAQMLKGGVIVSEKYRFTLFDYIIFSGLERDLKSKIIMIFPIVKVSKEVQDLR